MPQYDAFGREVGEDTLAGLRGGETTARPAPVAEAPPRPAPVCTAPRPMRRARRPRGLGWLVALAVLAAVVAGPVIAVIQVGRGAVELFDGLATELEREPAPPAPAGLGGRSMLAPDRVAAGLGRLRAEGIDRVAYIRVEPARFDAEGTRGGVATDFQLRHDGAEHHVDGGTPPARTFRTAAVDPAAPARLARRAAREGGFGAGARIRYAVTTIPPRGGHHWLAFFAGGVFAEGDAQGRLLRLSRP